MALPVYVINLARAPERLAGIEGQLKRLEVAWQRVDAIDRKTVDADAVRGEFGASRLSRSFPATLGDICCSLSHRRVWEMLLASGAESAVVLEDDALLSASFGKLVCSDLHGLLMRHQLGVLKLEHWPGPQQSRRIPLGEPFGPVLGHADINVYQMRSSFLGTCGYVISAEAVRTVLGRFPQMQVPVDHYLFGAAARMGFDLIRPGFLNPAPVLHGVDRFGSDIRDEREAGGQVGGPRTLGRKMRDWSERRREARELRRGEAERVEMRFAEDAFGMP
ncbi:MAG: glycosyltransferase family 25 protein [Albidovulum sp.]